MAKQYFKLTGYYEGLTARRIAQSGRLWLVRVINDGRPYYFVFIRDFDLKRDKASGATSIGVWRFISEAAAHSKFEELRPLKAQNVDLIYAAEEPTMRSDFEGKDVELIGQSMPTRANNAKGDRFNLVRMFVICCAADARPVAITVQTEKAQPVAEMSWVKVIGEVAFPVESGRRVPLVLAKSVTPCDPPEETFIY